MKRILYTILFPTHPILFSVLAWILSFIFILFMNTKYIIFEIIGVIIFISIGIFIIVSVIVAVITYPLLKHYILNLSLLYLTILLLFANIYFWMMLLFDPYHPFLGIHPPWEWIGHNEGRRLYINNAVITAVDCIHYSCVTITTLGFGDMRPIHWSAKIITDIEVLSGLGIITVGFGRLFAEKNIAS